ncbi:hypothetical protein LNTAR_00315 [Lentisphaera araneosa HTCC2155]|jgi:hypothetical protein|uniref:Uncharacterized protein n=1 Tax=Lentisphaera araneosa HTCC2155 TaxID=313628 RepID=A6DKA0_9BACT|nr:hypothetical protein LNTAR_00315 [Lentisphaera araneosa HTCC2155]
MNQDIAYDKGIGTEKNMKAQCVYAQQASCRHEVN